MQNMVRWQLKGYTNISLKIIKYVYAAQQNHFHIWEIVVFKTFKPLYFQLSILQHISSSFVLGPQEYILIKDGVKRRINKLDHFSLPPPIIDAILNYVINSIEWWKILRINSSFPKLCSREEKLTQLKYLDRYWSNFTSTDNFPDSLKV